MQLTTTNDLGTVSAELGTASDVPGHLRVRRATHAGTTSRGRLWTGRIMTGFVSLFLLFDAVIKLVRIPAAVEGTAKLGYPPGVLVPLGLVLLACVALYLVPRTAVFGAVLLTGYLGGAIATHVRVGDPLLTHALFPVYVAVLVWGGLFLRDARVRALLGPRS